MIDNASYFRDLFGEANRANVSFYPVDPRGLPAVDTDIGPTPPLPPGAGSRGARAANRDAADARGEHRWHRAREQQRSDKQMRRMADDLTSYYLLGYYSTNAKLDGRFRTIKVGVAPRHRSARAARLQRPQRQPKWPRQKRPRTRQGPPKKRHWTPSSDGSRTKGDPWSPRATDCVTDVAGEPVIFRRGPSTGNVLQRSTAREFSRTERLHIEMLPGQATGWTGALLDRTGKTLPIPVTTGERTDAANRVNAGSSRM